MRYFAAPVSIGFFLLFGSVVAKAAPTPGEINRIEAATRVFNEMPGRGCPLLKCSVGRSFL